MRAITGRSRSTVVVAFWQVYAVHALRDDAQGVRRTDGVGREAPVKPRLPGGPSPEPTVLFVPSADGVERVDQVRDDLLAAASTSTSSTVTDGC